MNTRNIIILVLVAGFGYLAYRILMKPPADNAAEAQAALGAIGQNELQQAQFQAQQDALQRLYDTCEKGCKRTHGVPPLSPWAALTGKDGKWQDCAIRECAKYQYGYVAPAATPSSTYNAQSGTVTPPSKNRRTTWLRH